MDEKRLRGMMGLCVRAGQAVFGEDGCRRSVSSGQCGVLLIDGAISGNSRKRYESLCESCGVRMEILPPDLIGEATGRPGVAMAVREGSFAQQILRCMQQDS